MVFGACHCVCGRQADVNAKGPVTDTLLPMTVLDDVVGIAVFFTVNSLIARAVSGGSLPMSMIPVMIFLPIIIGAAVGFPIGLLLGKVKGKALNLTVLLCGITATMAVGWLLNTYVRKGISLNYTLMGVAFSAVFSNMIKPGQVEELNRYMNSSRSLQPKRALNSPERSKKLEAKICNLTFTLLREMSSCGIIL